MIVVLRFLFVIPFGFVVACFAASFALLWPFLDKATLAARDPVLVVQTAIAFVAQAAQVGSAVAVPFAIFAVVTEGLGWHSLVLHIVAGLLGGFGVMRYAYGASMPHESVQTAMMVAGLGFMLVYWLVAGRGAGRWRRSVSPPAQHNPVDRANGPVDRTNGA